MADTSSALFPTTSTKVEVIKPSGRGYEWPLIAAWIWIVWRDNDRANAEWIDHLQSGTVSWRAGDLAQALSPPSQALPLLLEGLRSGDVRAFGERVDYPDPVLIEPNRWDVLFLEDGLPTEPDEFRSVRLLASDMKRLFPAATGNGQTFAPAARIKAAGQGGRPMKHDWAAAAGFLAGYARDNDPTPPEAKTVLLKWFTDRDAYPQGKHVNEFVDAFMQDYRPK